MSTTTLAIKALSIKTLHLPIEGLTPLLVHNWSHKAKQEMLEKMMKKKAEPRKAKDPEQEYRDSMYPSVGDDHGFPAVAFKCSAVRAAKLAGIPMVDARQMFFVLPDEGEMIRIVGEPRMREDVVSVQRGKDIRYRAEFKEWSPVLRVDYMISAQQVVDLFNMAGRMVGVGEWRPEKSGTHGTFKIVTED